MWVQGMKQNISTCAWCCNATSMLQVLVKVVLEWCMKDKALDQIQSTLSVAAELA